MSRTATLVGFAVIAVAMVGYQLVGVVRRRTPTIGQAVSVVTRWPAVRWLLVAGWLWLGWHVFVRSHVD